MRVLQSLFGPARDASHPTGRQREGTSPCTVTQLSSEAVGGRGALTHCPKEQAAPGLPASASPLNSRQGSTTGRLNPGAGGGYGVEPDQEVVSPLSKPSLKITGAASKAKETIPVFQSLLSWTG